MAHEDNIKNTTTAYQRKLEADRRYQQRVSADPRRAMQRRMRQYQYYGLNYLEIPGLTQEEVNVFLDYIDEITILRIAAMKNGTYKGKDHVFPKLPRSKPVKRSELTPEEFERHDNKTQYRSYAFMTVRFVPMTIKELQEYVGKLHEKAVERGFKA